MVKRWDLIHLYASNNVMKDRHEIIIEEADIILVP